MIWPGMSLAPIPQQVFESASVPCECTTMYIVSQVIGGWKREPPKSNLTYDNDEIAAASVSYPAEM